MANAPRPPVGPSDEDPQDALDQGQSRWDVMMEEYRRANARARGYEPEDPCLEEEPDPIELEEEDDEEDRLHLDDRSFDPISQADTAAARNLRIVSGARTRISTNQDFLPSSDPIMLACNNMFYVYPEVENTLAPNQNQSLFGQEIRYPTAEEDLSTRIYLSFGTYSGWGNLIETTYTESLEFLHGVNGIGNAEEQQAMLNALVGMAELRRQESGYTSYFNALESSWIDQLYSDQHDGMRIEVVKINYDTEGRVGNLEDEFREVKEQLFSGFFDNGRISRAYSYINASVPTPVSHANRTIIEDGGIPTIAKFQAVYNFYNSSYEPILSAGSRNVPHHLLPNIYMFATEAYSTDYNGQLLSDDNIPNGVRQFIRLGDSETPERILNVFRDVDTSDANPRKIGESSEGQYYQSWANTISSMQNPEYVSLLRSYTDYRNLIYVSSDRDAGMQTKIKNISRFIPMYAQIEFDSPGKADNLASEMSTHTRRVPFTPESHATDALLASDAAGVLMANSGQEYFVESFALEVQSGDSTRSQSKIQEKVRKIYNLEQWFENYSRLSAEYDPYQESASRQFSSDSYIVGESKSIRSVTREFSEDRRGSSNYLNNGMQRIEEKVSDLIREHRLSYRDVCNGHKTHSEILLFKIDKHLVLENGNREEEPVQSFYVMNGQRATGTNESDIVNRKIKYLDSQVKFGERYVYKVYAHLLVIGLDYIYFGDNWFPREGFEGDTFQGHPDSYMIVASFPSLNVLEIPYFNCHETIPEERILTTSISDNPPPSPSVEILPYINIDNQVMIKMEGSIDDYVATPIFLREGDEEKYEKISEFQRDFLESIETNTMANPGSTAVRFRSDDIVTGFEIFRTTTKPRSWASFRDNLLTTIGTGGMSNSSFYKDDVVPNVDYYYTFRAIDIHGNTSNPTAIYKLRMVNDAGLIYPMISTIALSDEVTEREELYTGTVDKYLSISPVSQQLVLNMAESGMLRSMRDFDPADLAPGTEIHNVYGGSATSVRLQADNKYVIGTTGGQGKKFKIRLTSKSSGKRLDLNVHFKIRQETPIIDPISGQPSPPARNPEEAAATPAGTEAENTGGSAYAEWKASLPDRGPSHGKASPGSIIEPPGKGKGYMEPSPKPPTNY